MAGVLDLGRRLGLDVVAEGVETAGQLRLLEGMGCAYVQGWLVGRPVDAGSLPALLAGFDPGVLTRRCCGSGHLCPASGTGWLTAATVEAHSVRVPHACLLVDGCSRSLLVVP